MLYFPILLISLHTLGITAISDPAKKMLFSLLDAIPNIITAGILLIVFYVIVKFGVSVRVISGLLANLDVDKYAGPE